MPHAPRNHALNNCAAPSTTQLCCTQYHMCFDMLPAGGKALPQLHATRRAHSWGAGARAPGLRAAAEGASLAVCPRRDRLFEVLKACRVEQVEQRLGANDRRLMCAPEGGAGGAEGRSPERRRQSCKRCWIGRLDPLPCLPGLL